MGTRGFTLLELLIALAVLAVMASLALPAVWGRMDSAKLRSAARQVEAAVVSVRASAQRRGEALALLAVHEPGGIRLRVETVGRDHDEGGMPGADRRGPGAAGVLHLGTLPAKVQIGPARAASDEVLPDAAAPGGLLRGLHDAESAPSTRLVLALPDGSLLVDGELRIWIGEGPGAAGEVGAVVPLDEAVPAGPSLLVRINRWTGVCNVTAAPLDDAFPGDGALSETDEPLGATGAGVRP